MLNPAALPGARGAQGGHDTDRPPENTPNPTPAQHSAPAAAIAAASRHLSAAERLAAALLRHHRAALVEAVGRAQEVLALALARATTSGTSERQRGEGGRS
jgi:hypothetical protein